MTLKFQMLEYPQLPNEYGMQFTDKAISDVGLLLIIWTFSILNAINRPLDLEGILYIETI